MIRIASSRSRAVVFVFVLLPTFDRSDRPAGRMTRARHARAEGGRHPGTTAPVPAARVRPWAHFSRRPTSWSAEVIRPARGYSPLDIYGDQTLPLYGPMSAFRVSTAPVLIYAGATTVSSASSRQIHFPIPIFPMSPVVYPTEVELLLRARG